MTSFSMNAVCFCALWLFVCISYTWAEYCTETYSCPATCYRQKLYRVWWSGYYYYYIIRSVAYSCTKLCSRQVCCEGYTGSDCSVDIDECSSEPCQNGGTCKDLVNKYTCDCADGYTGTECGTDIDECSSNPCQNGGTCNDHVNKYTCDCADGNTGTECGTAILK